MPPAVEQQPRHLVDDPDPVGAGQGQDEIRLHGGPPHPVRVENNAPAMLTLETGRPARGSIEGRQAPTASEAGLEIGVR